MCYLDPVCKTYRANLVLLGRVLVLAWGSLDTRLGMLFGESGNGFGRKVRAVLGECWDEF